MFIFMGGFFI